MYILLVVIAVLSPLTFAAWPYDITLPQINHDAKKSCSEWLAHYNITDNNYQNMIGKVAIDRDYKLDKKIHWIAAGYMGRLTIKRDAQRDDIVSPSDFCAKMGNSKNEYGFLALKDFRSKTCEEFIYIYGYSKDDLTYNMNVAKTYDKKYYVNKLSLWASCYTTYLLLNDTTVSPSTFCGKLKTATEYEMKFLEMEEIPRHCLETLKSYDFTDNSRQNHYKARTHVYPEEITFYIPYVVEKYIKLLLHSNESDAKSIDDFCAYVMGLLKPTKPNSVKYLSDVPLLNILKSIGFFKGDD